MTVKASRVPGFDPDAVHAKYREERDKRLVPGRAEIRELSGLFAEYTRDPFTSPNERQPVHDGVDVAIIGAGLAGICAGVRLRQAGAQRIRYLDRAGGVGGTWYWNRYPGVMCDVESYIYMPFLEELDYVPTERYASGDEIRGHLERLAKKFNLVGDALFSTGVISTQWHEDKARWVIRTDRDDEIHARYVVMAVGILNLLKLPNIPGMELFQGKSFHTARWDYNYTGGGPSEPLTKLSDAVVGLVGTGASAIQCVPPLVNAAKKLFVFQRTPSAVGERGNRPTSPGFVDLLYPGWQADRMDNFQALMVGERVDTDLVDDGWTQHMARVWNPSFDSSLSLEENMTNAEAFDFQIMEEHRRRVDAIVQDRAKATVLKPYYRYLCKRPCFHDEYLDAFNQPNLSLIDCPAGIERITERGLVVNGRTYEVDCLIYATGFEPEQTPFSRRAGYDIIGRAGISLSEKWKDGFSSLHAMYTRGFPNMFFMPAPGQQAVVTANHTHVTVEGANHLGATFAQLEARNAVTFEVSSEAERAWVDGIVQTFVSRNSVMAACTPSRINNEGHPEAINPRNSSFGGRLGDLWGYRETLAMWRERGDFDGLEVEP